MKQIITEEMKIHEEWYKEARKITAEKLPEFIRHLTEDYVHDYGTMIHACTAAAIAATWSVEHSPIGGITGFQAGAIMWEFIKHWNKENNKCGLQLMDYDNMLYPQYEYHFEKTISEDTWGAIQKEAMSRLMGQKTPPNVSRNEPTPVTEHWQSIVDGKIPFGYTISEEK